MTSSKRAQRQLLATIVDHIDIPPSYYEKAAARHRSLAEFLHREESAVAQFDPDIRPQGSFRYGTVIRPLFDDDEYDLDNVCLLRRLGKSALTQKQLKVLYGNEIRAYAKQHGMLAPAEEHHRCWRLRYADEIQFHLDTLPCIPEASDVIRGIAGLGVTAEMAQRAVAITDRRHPNYDQISDAWLTSNPRGFAKWFEQRASLGRIVTKSMEMRASIEDVPAYKWKTPLQRAIQVMKRHRDVMFRDDRDLAPISMIITNLAANAYEGEDDLLEALTNIVERMPLFVRGSAPFVPNPMHPAEDYADKWRHDERLKKGFWDWHAAFKSDLNQLGFVQTEKLLKQSVRSVFQVALSADELEQVMPLQANGAHIITSTTPALVIPTAHKPWGRHNDGSKR